MKAQFKTADRLKVKYAIVIGESEIEKDIISLRNLQTGEQVEMSTNNLAE